VFASNPVSSVKTLFGTRFTSTVLSTNIANCLGSLRDLALIAPRSYCTAIAIHRCDWNCASKVLVLARASRHGCSPHLNPTHLLDKETCRSQEIPRVQNTSHCPCIILSLWFRLECHFLVTNRHNAACCMYRPILDSGVGLRNIALSLRQQWAHQFKLQAIHLLQLLYWLLLSASDDFIFMPSRKYLGRSGLRSRMRIARTMRQDAIPTSWYRVCTKNMVRRCRWQVNTLD
jgi:hypothetical protein